MKRLLPQLCLSLLLPLAHAGDFKLASPDVPADGKLAEKQVYIGYGCNGGNQSPALQWSGVPAGAKSLALVLHDPDAPVSGGWYHWSLYDLPPATAGLPTNAGNSTGSKLPKGAKQGRTSFGGNSFGGACPPIGHGVHRYNFTLYALKVATLPLAEDTPPAEAEAKIKAASLGSASFTATYQR